MQIKSVGIVGLGAFGALMETLIRRFLPAIEVRIHSSRSGPDGKRFYSLEDTCAADALILAVPIKYFEQTVLKVLSHLATHTVLVDVSTVKAHPVEVLRRLAPDRQWLATHPMFGPESYKKKAESVEGFRIVLAEHTLPEEDFSALSTALATVGFDVVTMPSATHDEHLAETLFLTHFIGQSVARAKFTRTEIDTVSFGYLMDAMESVRNDTELFKDVYAYNPYCEQVLERLMRAEEEVRKLLDSAS
jgi:prephenate dehydrogenase